MIGMVMSEPDNVQKKRCWSVLYVCSILLCGSNADRDGLHELKTEGDSSSDLCHTVPHPQKLTITEAVKGVSCGACHLLLIWKEGLAAQSLRHWLLNECPCCASEL